MKEPITSFSNYYRPLSNFWPSPVDYLGLTYPTIEHAYQAAKTENIEVRRDIQQAKTPGKAKRLGRRCSLILGWEKSKDSIMLELVTQKFTRYSGLRKLLLTTGEIELIEGNTWGDIYWGVCQGEGQNKLGEILMKIRFELALDLEKSTQI